MFDVCWILKKKDSQKMSGHLIGKMWFWNRKQIFYRTAIFNNILLLKETTKVVFLAVLEISQCSSFSEQFRGSYSSILFYFSIRNACELTYFCQIDNCCYMISSFYNFFPFSVMSLIFWTIFLLLFNLKSLGKFWYLF